MRALSAPRPSAAVSQTQEKAGGPSPAMGMAAKERRPGSVPALREAQLWRWSLAPGERYTAEPDPAGWHEMIAVVEGVLRVGIGGRRLNDRACYAIYSSAQAYAYFNDGDGPVRLIRSVVSWFSVHPFFWEG